MCGSVWLQRTYLVQVLAAMDTIGIRQILDRVAVRRQRMPPTRPRRILEEGSKPSCFVFDRKAY